MREWMVMVPLLHKMFFMWSKLSHFQLILQIYYVAKVPLFEVKKTRDLSHFLSDLNLVVVLFSCITFYTCEWYGQNCRCTQYLQNFHQHILYLAVLHSHKMLLFSSWVFRQAVSMLNQMCFMMRRTCKPIVTSVSFTVLILFKKCYVSMTFCPLSDFQDES